MNAGDKSRRDLSTVGYLVCSGVGSIAKPMAWWHTPFGRVRLRLRILPEGTAGVVVIPSFSLSRVSRLLHLRQDHLPAKSFQKNLLSGNFIHPAPVRQGRTRKLNRKEVMKVKSIKLLVNVVFLTGAVGFSAVSSRAEMVISKDVFTNGSYCHTKFESIDEDTLASGQPALKDVDDIIDFYGPCDHDPLGKEEIHSQKLEMQHRLEKEYSD